MDNLTPITREEMLMNDEPLTPITREEKILAGEDLNPVTRREYFLKKYRHAGGDVMVEGLEVTANGTYTAPEGKAYSPVEVAVPLPDNAYLLKEASGSLVSFSDGADLPMPSFICNIDAVQDLHGYDAPWVGGAGKNITPPLDQVKSDSGLTVTPQSDGSVIINGTYTGETGWYVITKTFTVYANKTYSVSVGDIASGLINAYGLNGYGQAHTITPTADFNTNVRLNINNGTVFNNVRLYPQTELGEQATPYAPYSNICPISGHTGVDAVISPTTEASAGTTYSVSWQTEAGEVFGGYVDLVSGELTVTGIMVNFPSCLLAGSGYRRFVRNLAQTTLGLDLTHKDTCISNILEYMDAEVAKPFGYFTVTDSNWLVVPDKDSRFETAEELNQFMANQGAKLRYPLATPITYQLTPQQIKSLLGNNNAWCSTGDIEIDYFAKEVTG